MIPFIYLEVADKGVLGPRINQPTFAPQISQWSWQQHVFCCLIWFPHYPLWSLLLFRSLYFNYYITAGIVSTPSRSFFKPFDRLTCFALIHWFDQNAFPSWISFTNEPLTTFSVPYNIPNPSPFLSAFLFKNNSLYF